MSSVWVKASLPPMMGPLPGWVAAPLPLVLMALNRYTVVTYLLVLIAGAYMSAKGRSLSWVWRRFKSMLRAGRIQSRPLSYRRRLNALVHVNNFSFEQWRNR